MLDTIKEVYSKKEYIEKRERFREYKRSSNKVQRKA